MEIDRGGEVARWVEEGFAPWHGAGIVNGLEPGKEGGAGASMGEEEGVVV